MRTRALALGLVVTAAALTGCGGAAAERSHTIRTSQPRIMEDDPGWNCRTMGNKRCGPIVARHERQVRRALRLGGFAAPVVAVHMGNQSDVTVGTIGDARAVCNTLVNGGALPAWTTHVYVSSTHKGSASWIPGDAACH